jgi:hypothetical protein
VGGTKGLVLYPGDDHGVERRRSEMLEKLYGGHEELLLLGEEHTKSMSLPCSTNGYRPGDPRDYNGLLLSYNP